MRRKPAGERIADRGYGHCREQQQIPGRERTAALLLQIVNGFVKTDVYWLALLALPATLIGARIGTRVYHALSDRNFYDLVLGLLFLSGLALMWSSIAPR
jgi:uncharacterized membrane protein YfcA